MSNKTIIPGVTPSYNNDGINSLYAPSSNNNDGKTYIPDIYRNQTAPDGEAPKHDKRLNLQDRTLAGILFSISRTSSGEIFPIYLGRNTIGSDLDCDVWLGEATVSPSHAVLAVRRIKNEDGSILFQASITDYDSRYGTTLNGEKLEYDRLECHNGDILCVGHHYQLLLYLFDTVQNKLFVDINFDSLERPAQPEPDEMTVRLQLEPDEPKKKEEEYTTTMSDDEMLAFYAPTRKIDGTHSQNTTVIQ